ncbi:hypothetical protein RvY_15896 [Ramazzottius varieornatus]|uniref:Uncharacterized protein n=1 Tax=Ramazzottius varieornatus TaxID=947166 RepID=A0A1D1W367_RAMVA|nr:hypothetical protein RvY_15896 [Ramazzottius varieornatus]
MRKSYFCATASNFWTEAFVMTQSALILFQLPSSRNPRTARQKFCEVSTGQASLARGTHPEQYSSADPGAREKQNSKFLHRPSTSTLLVKSVSRSGLSSSKRIHLLGTVEVQQDNCVPAGIYWRPSAITGESSATI